MNLKNNIKNLREDKTISEMVWLIVQLIEKIKSTKLNIIDAMLPKQKTSNFL